MNLYSIAHIPIISILTSYNPRGISQVKKHKALQASSLQYYLFMKNVKRKNKKRSVMATFVAGAISLIIAAILFLMWPPRGLPEILFFLTGLFLLVLSVIIATEGRKELLEDLFWLITFWR